MIRPVPIPFPHDGRDDSVLSIAQPVSTTQSAQNVRGALNGKEIGGRRPGMALACSVPLGATGARAMAAVSVDRQHVAYELLDEPETAWAVTGPSGRDCYAVGVDFLGDSYWLEGGTHVVIRTPEGTERTVIVLPVGDAGQVCRALAVDPLIRRFYVAVSEGGTQETAKLWRYEEDQVKGWEAKWELLPGAYIEKLEVADKGVSLIAGLNDTDTGRSWVVEYGSLSGAVPIERWRAQVPAPVTCMDERDGKIAVGSGFNSLRGTNPQHPTAGQILDAAFAGYEPKSITDADDRVYAFLTSDDALGQEQFEGDGDGQAALPLGDHYGLTRRLYVTGQSEHVNAQNVTLAGSQPANNDTITFALPDGTYSETYTFKTALTPAVGEILRGANLAASLANLEDAIENGGDGTTAATGTGPSSLLFGSNLTLAKLILRANTNREVVEITVTGGLLTVDGAATARAASGKDVETVAPTVRANGMAGRRGIAFNGLDQKMRTLFNANALESNKGDHHTLIPGWGINEAPASSARFAAWLVVRVYPTYWKACIFAQTVRLAGGGTWTRRVAQNCNDTGAYEQGKIAVVENDGGTVRFHAASYDAIDGFVMVTWVHDPDGAGYEVYINGAPALNALAVHTGTAVANDSVFPTTLGHNDAEGRFAEFEFYRWLCVSSSGVAPCSSSERELYEGMFAWEFGAQALLPVGHPYQTVPPPPPGQSVLDWYTARKVISTTPIVTKLDAKTREIAWMAASDNTTPATIGALGSGLAWLSTGDLVSWGPPILMFGTGSDPASVRLLVDKGEDFELGWFAEIGTTQSESFSYDKLQGAVDEEDRVWIPFQADKYGAEPPQFLVYDSAGTLVLSPVAEQGQAAYAIALQPSDVETLDYPERVLVALRREGTTTATMSALPADGDQITFSGEDDSGPVTDVRTFVTALANPGDVLIGATVSETLSNLKASINLGPGESTLYGAGTGRAVLVTATTLDASTLDFSARWYLTDTTAESSTAAVTFDPELPDPFVRDTGNARQIRIVGSTVVGAVGRERALAYVEDGSIKLATRDNAQTTTGGGGVMSASVRYWSSVAFQRWVFFTDGLRAYVYDTIEETTEPWIASSGGALPQRFQLLETYRQRVLATGIAGLPYSIAASANGDAFDWNRKRIPQDGTQSFQTHFDPSGDVPDLVNGIVPIGDDLAVILGDHTMIRMTGDPAPGSNGTFDPIPTAMGGAFGRAWCMTPYGPVVWTSEGFPAFLSIEGDPRSVCGAAFDRTFQEVDLATHFVRLAWNTRLNQIDVVACPYGGEALTNKAFVIQAPPPGSSRWRAWPDERPDGPVFTDMIVADGDNVADRRTLFACTDGSLVTWDEAAEMDIGVPFLGRVVVGPLATRDDNLQTVLNELRVLLDAQSGDCSVEVWASDEPDFARAVMRRRWTLRPGQSPTLPGRVAGNYLWLVVAGRSRWQYQMALAVFSAGARKRRSA